MTPWQLAATAITRPGVPAQSLVMGERWLVPRQQYPSQPTYSIVGKGVGMVTT